MSPSSPKGLSAESRRLWTDIATEFAITDSPGLMLLETALRAFDRARECEKQIARDGVAIVDRYGNPRSHPLLAVPKDSNNTLLASLKALDVDPTPLKARIGRPPGRRGER